MDPLISSALIAGGVSAASGIANLFGGRHTDRKNVQEAREYRNWSEKMAGSQYQRAVEDLKAAGLNPLLAVGGQASVPSASPPTRNNNVGQAVSSAAEVYRSMRESAATQAQIRNLDAQTALTLAKTDNEMFSASGVSKRLIDSITKDMLSSDKAKADAAGKLTQKAVSSAAKIASSSAFKPFRVGKAVSKHAYRSYKQYKARKVK